MWGVAKPISVQVSKQFILLYLGLVPEFIVFEFFFYFFFLASEPESTGIGAQGKLLHVLPSR